MMKFSTSFLLKLDNWIPLFLLVLPTIMLLVPLIVEVDPLERLYALPAIPKAFLVGVILYSILSTGFNKLKSFSPPRVITLTSALLAGIAWYTTFFVAENRSFSAIKDFELLLFIGVAIFSSKILERGGKALIRRLLAAIFLSLIISLPLATLLITLETPDYYYWPILIPGFDHIRIYGFSLTASIAIGTGLLAVPSFQRPVWKWLVLFCLCLLWATLFWSSSRGGIVALIAVAPVTAFLVPAFRKPLVYFVFSLLVGALIASQIQSQIPDIGFSNTFTEITEPVDLTGTGSGRLEEWKLVADMIGEKPFFGHGLGQVVFTVKTVVPRFHVHNIVLEALLAWGIFGAACAGFLIIRLWFYGLEKVNNPSMPELIPAFYTISVLLVYAWVDGTYFYYQSMIPLAFCSAVMMTKLRSG